MAPAEPVCPSRDFSAFFKRFVGEPTLQLRYTRLPLEYGRLDQGLVGTAQEDQAFKTRMIKSFAGIPSRQGRTSMFPGPAEMEKKNLQFEIVTISNSKTGKDFDPEQTIADGDHATATLFLPDSGFRVHYRFQRAGGCWRLYAISDRSI